MTDARISQGVVYAGFVTTAPDVYATQSASYAGFETSGRDVRASQAVVYAGFLFAPPVQVTQTVVYAGYPSLTPCGTHRATCWKIVRRDGEAFYFTSHDEPVYILGNNYTPCASLSRSAYELSAELGSTDNLDVAGLISDDAISEADLFAGAFDGASVEVYEVDWATSPVNAKLLAGGTAGQLQHRDTGYVFEVVTASQKLQTKALLQQVTPTCRWELGSSNTSAGAGCGVDLEALRVSGTVTSVAGPDTFRQSPRRTFTDTSRAEAADYFKRGVLTWTSGANAGLSVEVKEFSSGQFILWQELREAIRVGDEYTATPGCDKRFEGDCGTKFSNKENFGGFPWLPGRDFLTKRGDK